jgi:protein-S-isoprenylcysteine O-methyltransferase Ste14
VTEAALEHGLLLGWFALAPLTLLVLLVLDAPYGRHTRAGWGPTVASRVGWVLMEAPAVIGFAVVFALGRRPGIVEWVLFGLWQSHYLFRAFVFPFRMRGATRPMPLAIAGFGALFNLANTYLNARYITHFSAGYSAAWLLDPRFLVGVALFAAGMRINRQSDRILFSLRKEGDTGYHIPRGGGYRWVSCPNYLGEIVEWSGWALATWSLPGLAFAVWTAANLIPRARANHRWYLERFPDYPRARRAVIPFVL